MTIYPGLMEEAFAVYEDRKKRRRNLATSGLTYQFRGGNLRAFGCANPEMILAGPASTGKTIATLSRLHRLAVDWPGAQLAIVRKTYASMVGTVVQSFKSKILGPNSPVVPYGGESPIWFDYPNGSRIWIGGMDNPNRILSSERDAIYVNQAEELTVGEWETLLSRATGRAGNIPKFGQLFGDCNPASERHWIPVRADEGALTLITSRHEDNPRIYDDAGHLTEQGRVEMAALDRMTGIRRARLRDGRWASVEGAVYPMFSRDTHVVPRFDLPAEWRRFCAVDFGYTNPFVCGWFAVDPDGRLILYRYLYRTQRTIPAHVAQIKSLSVGERIETYVCDHDAGERAQMGEAGLFTIAAEKEIVPGIQEVTERLALAGDGKPRLTICRDALVEADTTLVESKKPFAIEQEFDAYVYPKGSDGKPNKEAPVKEFDHAMDMLRYACMYARRSNLADFIAAQKRG